jgi:hypothetical protein
MNKKINISAAFYLILLLSACEIGLHEPIHGTGADGKVIIPIRIQNLPEAAGRSVLPQVSLEDIAYYELRGGMSGEEESVLIESFTDTEGASVILDTGTWNFTLNGYKDDALFLQGKLQNKPVSSSSDSLDFFLMPLNSGQGAIHITIQFPAGSGIASVVAVTEDDSEEVLTVDGNQAVYAKSPVDAGNYFIGFELKDNNGILRGVVSELVLVRGYVLSEKIITLTAADLKPELVAEYVIPEGGAVVYLNTPSTLAAIIADISDPVVAVLGLVVNGYEKFSPALNTIRLWRDNPPMTATIHAYSTVDKREVIQKVCWTSK